MFRAFLINTALTIWKPKRSSKYMSYWKRNDFYKYYWNISAILAGLCLISYTVLYISNKSNGRDVNDHSIKQMPQSPTQHMDACPEPP